MSKNKRDEKLVMMEHNFEALEFNYKQWMSCYQLLSLDSIICY